MKILYQLFSRVALVVAILAISPSAFAQGPASGTVKDAIGPVSGASVVVQGTRNGVITDMDGNFSLEGGVKKGDILEISCIGYVTQNIPWNGVPLNVMLEEDNELLEEVVVVGYGVQKKVNVTGSVSMVGSEVIESRPVANISQALQGAVPGLNLTVNSNGGMLNNTMSMNIRGTGSIGSGSTDSPLVLIDGIEGNINALNPNDVESISVLKDAASASIYGARAAFGVILVTTKNGKAGKVKVNYSGDVRFSTATQLPDMVNSLDWAYYFNEANINGGAGQTFSNETIQNMKDYQAGKFANLTPDDEEYYKKFGTTPGGNGRWSKYGAGFANTNWFKEHYKSNVPSTQHNISMSGGTEAINWMVSGSFLLNNGLIRHGHDQLNRYTLNAKIGAKLADWARMDYNTKWTRSDYEKPQYLSDLFFHNIARRWPSCPVIDPNGHYVDEMEIVELEDGGIYRQLADYNTQQLRFTINPIEGWNIVAEAAIRTTNQKTTENDIPPVYYMVDDTPFVRGDSYGSNTWVYDSRFRQNYYAINVFTDYSRTIGQHYFKVLAGLNFEKYLQDSLSGQGTNLTTEEKPYISQAQDNFKTSDAYWHRAVAGYFARVNYDYAGRYLAEVNLRYDGSSRFLADKRWALFPSFSLGWNIARENFWDSYKDKVSTLKLRASWGSLGNTSSSYSSFSDYYPFYQQQSIGAANSAWLVDGKQLNTSSLPGIVNSTMTWETIQTLDFGLDLAALNNRLTMTFDWFSRTTKDMIGPAPVLGSALGTNAPSTNNCKMRSNGWEIEVGWRDSIGQVKYNVRVNVSDAKSKILDYPYDGDFENQSISGYYNGKVLGEIWGYKAKGIAQSNEEITSWIETNKPNWGSNWQAGDIMYKDLNGDGKVTSGANTLADHGDLVRIGNSTSRYRFGINIGLEWKGFDFSAFFQGVAKRDYMFGEDDAYFWGAQGNVWQSCVFAEHLDFWRDENSYAVQNSDGRLGVNTDAYYPRPYFGGINKNHKSMDRYLQNAAYLRCKNIQFGYTLPAAVLNRAGISTCRLYVSCDNLFTLTQLSKIYDPEVISGSYGTGKTYPLQRTWSLGASISF